MNDELYINEKRVDLPSGQQIALNKQFHDLSTLSNRNASRTNQLSLPATRNNKRIFGFMDAQNSDSNTPYRKSAARYIQDGVEIISDGIAFALEAQDSLKVVVYSGIVDFFELLGNSKLSDLDFSDLDHDWTPTNALNSQANTEGYIYAVADWGVLSSTNNVLRLRYQHHSIFIKTIVERIFTSRGWTVSGPLIDNIFYQKLVLPFINGEIKSSVATAIKSIEVNQTLPSTYAGNGTNKFIFNNEVNDQLNYFDLPNSEYKPTRETTAKYTLEVRVIGINIGSPAQGITIQIVSVKGVTVKAEASYRFTANDNGRTIKIVTSDVKLNPGDVLKAEVVKNNVVDVINFASGAKLSSEAFANIVPGDRVIVSENMPDISQRSFLLSVFNMFAAIPDKKPHLNEIEVKLFNNIIENKINAVDMSDRIDFKNRPRVQFRLDGYGQNNNLKYKFDDLVTNGYGNGIISVDDETLNDSADLIELEFAASETTIKTGSSTHSMARLDLYGTDNPEGIDGVIDVRTLLAVSYSGDGADGLVPFDNVIDNSSGFWNAGTFFYEPSSAVTISFEFSFTIAAINLENVWGDIRIAIQKVNGSDVTDLVQFKPSEDEQGETITIETGEIQLTNEDRVKVQVDLDRALDFIGFAPGAKLVANPSYKIQSPEPRIMALKQEPFVGFYDNEVNLAVINTTMNFGYFIDGTQQDNLGFNDNLLDSYYKGISDALIKAKKITVPMRLSINDFHDFDPFTPWYLDVPEKDLSGYFYVNKIDRYQNNKLTNVELIRL